MDWDSPIKTCGNCANVCYATKTDDSCAFGVEISTDPNLRTNCVQDILMNKRLRLALFPVVLLAGVNSASGQVLPNRDTKA